VQNLYTRTITGIFFTGLIIGSLLLHPIAFAVVIFVMMIVGLLEFYRLAASQDIYPQQVLGFIVGAVIYIIVALIALGILSALYLALLPVLLLLFFIAELYRTKPNSILNVTFSIFPIAYVSIPFAMLIFLMNPLVTGDQPHWHLLFSFFFILWSNDTFAYLVGITMGKHKLSEKISPKKTWEGVIGGILFGLLAAFIISIFFKELTLWQWLLAALSINISGIFGDLSESLLKRHFQVKDSGNIFPGHGGILDRFDSVIFSAPVLFCYLLLLNL
jgi:phosphatidate cytidylyltransferase